MEYLLGSMFPYLQLDFRELLHEISQYTGQQIRSYGRDYADPEFTFQFAFLCLHDLVHLTAFGNDYPCLLNDFDTHFCRYDGLPAAVENADTQRFLQLLDLHA